jgi:hypothetical protein
MPLISIKKMCKSISSFFIEDQFHEKNYAELQQMYEKSHPKLKKQKLGDLLKPVICDGSIDDTYFSTNIYPYIGFSKEMNWGYSGCGPQVLALNIIFLFSEGDGAFARKHYQSFLQDFLKAKKQNEDLEISVTDINRWIHARKRKPATILRLVKKGDKLV